MRVYSVVNVQITDPARYAEYREKAPSTIARYGGKYLARGGEVECSRATGIPNAWSSSNNSRAWSDLTSGTTRRNTLPSSNCAAGPPSQSLSSSKACKRKEQIMRIEAKLEELGLVLPEPMQGPPGLRFMVHYSYKKVS